MIPPFCIKRKCVNGWERAEWGCPSYVTLICALAPGYKSGPDFRMEGGDCSFFTGNAPRGYFEKLQIVMFTLEFKFSLIMMEYG